jgi:glycosyltransferase involved in cell wall biosynthesis
MASIEEGFGLPLAEGYKFGVPSVMPRSIDAFVDLYDEKCCVPADDYSVDVFAKALYNALSRKWDREKIKAFSLKFTEEKCAEGYLTAIRKSANVKKTVLSVEVLDEICDISMSCNLADKN